MDQITSLNMNNNTAVNRDQFYIDSNKISVMHRNC